MLCVCSSRTPTCSTLVDPRLLIKPRSEVFAGIMKHQKFLVRALALGALMLAGGLRTAAAGDDIVLYARNAVTLSGAWSRVTDSSAAGGARMANSDAGAAKLSAALASPASYFDVSFTAKT